MYNDVCSAEEKEKKKRAKERKIRAEIKRLAEIFQKIEQEKKDVTAGLVERAGFMRVWLEELEEDINQNGFTELFSQGDQKPYLRKRPSADAYNQMNNSYQKIIKQLTDLLPKEDNRPAEDADGFEVFVNGREE